MQKILTNIDFFNVAAWVVLILAAAVIVTTVIKLFPLWVMKMVADPMHTVVRIIQIITNEKIVKQVAWMHAKISEKLKKWWLKIQ